MRDLVVVQMNDLHGYLEPHCEWFWAPSGFVYRKAGGMARIKTMIDQLRMRYGDILFCDGGDQRCLPAPHPESARPVRNDRALGFRLWS